MKRFVALTIIVTTAACDGVLGLGQFTFDASSLPGDATDECVGAGGCWACTPTTNDQFLNSCSSNACVTFDTTRLTPFLVDGGLPPLPAVQDAAVDVVVDAQDGGG